VPLAEEIEIISWNYHLHQYEFLLITNYRPLRTGETLAQVTPVLFSTGQKENCSSCHQNGAGILPRAPWQEFLAQNFFGGDSKALTQVIENGRLLAIQENPILIEFSDRTEFSPIDFNFFDSAIRDSNSIVQTAKICNQACGSSIQCKKEMLYMALVGDNLTPLEVLDEQSMFTNAAGPTWPTHSFGYRSSILPDRNPLEGKEGTTTTFKVKDEHKTREELMSMLNNQLFRGHNQTPKETEILGRQDKGINFVKRIRENVNLIGYDEGIASLNLTVFPATAVIKNKIDTLGSIISTNGETSLNPGDPKTLRPIVSKATPAFAVKLLSKFGGFACYGLSETQRAPLMTIHRTNLQRFIFDTTVFDEFVRQNDFSGKTILDLFEKNKSCLSHGNCQEADLTKFTQAAKTNTTIVSGQQHVSKKPRDANTPGAIVSRYCANCHGVPGAPRPLPVNLADQVPNQELEKLSKYRSSSGKGALDYVSGANGVTQMPPATAKQPSPQEREILIKELQRYNKH
jgi:mono/diheme cytochrome c family protein